MTGLCINRWITDYYKYIITSLVIPEIVSENVFAKLQKYNKIQYAAVTQNINIILDKLYIIKFTTLTLILLTIYMNVNFNKMLETFIFQRSYAQYL